MRESDSESGVLEREGREWMDRQADQYMDIYICSNKHEDVIRTMDAKYMGVWG